MVQLLLRLCVPPPGRQMYTTVHGRAIDMRLQGGLYRETRV